jgi:hypothetical protein
MGLIKFGGGVAGISGKVGGTVYARNKTGAYARNWVNPVFPNSTKQQAVNNTFASLISEWKALTAAQQQAWETAAPNYPYTNRLGESSQYTGQQLFNHLNMNLLTVGLSIIPIPAAPGTFSSIYAFALTMSNTAGVLTTAEWEASDNGLATESLIIEMTPVISSGITKPAKGYFKQTLVVNTAASAILIDVATEYIALFGSPALGSRIYARAYMINETTGQRIALGQVVATVTGT